VFAARANANPRVIASITKLDLGSGRISGEKAKYYLDLPNMWVGYMTADMERVTNNSMPLERVRFYYKPMAKGARRIPIVTVTVYSRSNYSLETGHKKLFESKENVFSAWVANKATDKKIKNETDMRLFNTLVDYAEEDHNLCGMFRLEDGDSKMYSSTIWVNGWQINTKSISEGSITYLPLRSVCETLGYNVGWLDSQNAVTLKRGGFYAVLVLNNLSVSKGHKILLADGVAYISSLYFISQLKLNVEIDERGNVLLYE
jgi:hypothetical protein